MAYTTINKSTDYFNTVTYTGTGSSQNITGVGHNPDWVWIKRRNGTRSHRLFDNVRGVHKSVASNSNDAQADNSYTLTGFITDGFSLGSDSGNYGVNISGETQVAWNWKAGGATGSSNNDGSVASTVSANTTAGFSICKFTYPSSGNFTFGHGLGVAPRMFILKGITGTANWQVYHESLGNTKNTQLNSSSESNSAANWWGSTSPSSTVCTVGADLIETGQDAIAYCFAEKTGYSKFGSYTGNGNADGTFVYTGFAPAFVITKNTSINDWWGLFDNKRLGYNSSDSPRILFPNTFDAESSSKVLDFTSNGFKIKTSNGAVNGSGNTIIYMAFGQTLVGSNNIPATAR